MGGEITVKSEFGVGSTFTVIIPQGKRSNAPVAAVEKPESKRVLVYEPRKIHAETVCWALSNLHIPYTLVADADNFEESFRREEWFYVFSAYHLHDKIKGFMEYMAPNVEKKPPLALIVDWGTEAQVPNARFISMPVNSYSVANTLNGESDRRDNADSSLSFDAIQFTVPGARLLVVDDITANLKVATGLLLPYNAKVDTCLSGREAIELVMEHDYDIVFMDHMMPEMNGIEATAEIRAWEKGRLESDGGAGKQIPIVALTANAVFGMREMFIENGFNAFLAKPINTSELDYILDRWIPDEKKNYGRIAVKINGSKNDSFPFPKIPGLDTARGIVLAGGNKEIYHMLFCEEVEERLPILLSNNCDPTLVSFHAHALVNVSDYIGSADAVRKAKALQNAGNAGDFVLIEEKLAELAECAEALVKNIRAVFRSGEGSEKL
jgi:CheY-like chemotaxis protein